MGYRGKFDIFYIQLCIVWCQIQPRPAKLRKRKSIKYQNIEKEKPASC